jgi:hypothetical protein
MFSTGIDNATEAIPLADSNFINLRLEVFSSQHRHKNLLRGNQKYVISPSRQHLLMHNRVRSEIRTCFRLKNRNKGTGIIFLFLFAPIWELGPTLEHRADFSVSWSFTDGRTPWTGDQLVARPLPNHRTTQTQKNAHTHQTSMTWVGFETTIPASERAKTVHASDCSATVTGNWNKYLH